MAIPQEVLNNWAKQASNQKASNTYQRFKEIAEHIYGSKIDIFLQGSYANDTNIKSESDVDIVICFNDAILSKSVYGYYNTYNTTSIDELRELAYKDLNNRFNFALTKGSKTIKYSGNQDYLPVDLVPCGVYSGAVIGNKGIAIFDHDDFKTYINYPKQHIENGHLKSNHTNGNYKKTVRMFKNAKEKLIDKLLITNSKVAPSYFIECLIYNVPNENFVNDNYKCFYNVLNWLYHNQNNLMNFKCPNEKHQLFEQRYDYYNNQQCVYKKWNISNAIEFINALAKLWNNWGK